MEIELRIDEVEPGMRWNRLQSLAGVPAVAHFLSYRDDAKLVWFREPGAAVPDDPLVQRTTVHHLTPAFGSTIGNVEDLGRIDANVLEIRRYRIAPGQRDRFARFFHDRTLDAQRRCGIAIYGQFNDRDDENLLVWLRGFPNLLERERRKADFYQSRYWVDELQDEAYAMIEDYTNVLLVMPVTACA